MTNPITPNSGPPSADSDDLQLAAFLKANRPPTPEPHPDSETRLMRAIATTPQDRPFVIKRSWLIAAIALISALIGGLWWQLSQRNSGVFAQRELELETFLVETWQGVSEPEESLAELDWLEPQGAISEGDTSESFAYQSNFQKSHP